MLGPRRDARWHEMASALEDRTAPPRRGQVPPAGEQRRPQREPTPLPGAKGAAGAQERRRGSVHAAMRGRDGRGSDAADFPPSRRARRASTGGSAALFHHSSASAGAGRRQRAGSEAGDELHPVTLPTEEAPVAAAAPPRRSEQRRRSTIACETAGGMASLRPASTDPARWTQPPASSPAAPPSHPALPTSAAPPHPGPLQATALRKRRHSSADTVRRGRHPSSSAARDREPLVSMTVDVAGHTYHVQVPVEHARAIERSSARAGRSPAQSPADQVVGAPRLASPASSDDQTTRFVAAASPALGPRATWASTPPTPPASTEEEAPGTLIAHLSLAPDFSEPAAAEAPLPPALESEGTLARALEFSTYDHTARTEPGPGFTARRRSSSLSAAATASTAMSGAERDLLLVREAHLQAANASSARQGAAPAPSLALPATAASLWRLHAVVERRSGMRVARAWGRWTSAVAADSGHPSLETLRERAMGRLALSLQRVRARGPSLQRPCSPALLSRPPRARRGDARLRQPLCASGAPRGRGSRTPSVCSAPSWGGVCGCGRRPRADGRAARPPLPGSRRWRGAGRGKRGGGGGGRLRRMRGGTGGSSARRGCLRRCWPEHGPGRRRRRRPARLQCGNAGPRP